MAQILSDSQLVARCRSGDQQAWAELVDRFSRYVYAISVQGFRLSEADAEDVFQEVFARAYEHLDKLRDDAAVRPWLDQVLAQHVGRADRGRDRVVDDQQVVVGVERQAVGVERPLRLRRRARQLLGERPQRHRPCGSCRRCGACHPAHEAAT